MNAEERLAELHSIDQECVRLERIAAVLQWDQETYLPPQGVAERSEQLALIQGLAHDRSTAPKIGELLAELGSDSANPSGDERLPPVERDFLRVLRKDYDRKILLPSDFVSSAARAEGLSQAAWVIARRNNDFAAFKPHLQKMIEISRKKAEYWGYQGAGIYDALLDCYEPGLRAQDIAPLFAILQERLSALLAKIRAHGGNESEDDFLAKEYAPEKQAAYSQILMDRIGFDKTRGRIDVSAHPFTTTLGAHDIRITTRYVELNFLSSIFSTLHESGHGLYELNIAPVLLGGSLGAGVSMGIHESQSRFWENLIGRSRAFWQGQYRDLQQMFPEQLAGLSLDAFYRGINRVRPGLIRIEADEVCYSLHIILRFELEQKLFSGELTVDELPETWRIRMEELLGVRPETDSEGVLQDVHWSSGYFGYFPSYALGNCYGLQFWNKLQEDLPGVENAISQGKFEDLHAWLRDAIHAWGRRLDPPDLLRQVTGESLSVFPFLNYIESKFSELYGI